MVVTTKTEQATNPTEKYRAALVAECRALSAAQDARTKERLIKRFSGGTLALRLSYDDYNAAGVKLSRKAGILRVSLNASGVSVGVSPVALFAAVASVRGEAGINARECFAGVLSDLKGDACALAAFNQVVVKRAEKNPSPVFAALMAA